MVYRLALGTGFRAKELRSLTPESFELDGDMPAVIVAAAYSKHRRKDRQPIRRDLADMLRPWLADKPQGQPVFGRLPSGTSRILQSDLAAARKAWLQEAPSEGTRRAREKCDFLKYENAAAEVVDFHAMRHTYISGIVAGGASVKTAQELARHSDPALTIGRYSHARPRDMQNALDTMPSLVPAAPKAEAQGNRSVIVGTDGDQPTPPPGASAEKICVQICAHLGGERWQNTAENTPREDTRTPPVMSGQSDSFDSPQVEEMAGFRLPLAGVGEGVEGDGFNPSPGCPGSNSVSSCNSTYVPLSEDDASRHAYPS
jgi:hypothetical protein